MGGGDYSDIRDQVFKILGGVEVDESLYDERELK